MYPRRSKEMHLSWLLFLVKASDILITQLGTVFFKPGILITWKMVACFHSPVEPSVVFWPFFTIEIVSKLADICIFGLYMYKL